MGFKDFFKKKVEIFVTDKKLKAYDNFIEADSKNIDIWNSLYDLGRKEEALKAYQKAIELKPNNQKAWKKYEKAIEFKPDDYESWLKKGNFLDELGRKEEALKAYQKAIELKPDNDVTWNNIGKVLDDLYRKEEALKAYQKAIELNPDDDVTWNNIGCVLDDLGRKEEALKAYQKAIELNPDDDVTWNNIGKVLDDLGRKEEALKAYQKASELKPDNDVTWNNIGKVLDDLGRKEEALKANQKAIELKPDDDVIWFNKGYVLSNLGRKEEALKAYQKAIELKPNNQMAWNAYEKAIEFKPDDYESWLKKGNFLDELGRKEEALKAYQKAIELKPNDQRAWFNTGNVFDDLGKYEDAIKCYKKLRELDPEAKNVEEKLQDAERKYIESSLKTLKLEIEDAKKYIFIPQEISEIAEKGVSQKFDYARDSLKKLLSEAKPVLSVELDKTSLNLNEWYRSRIKIENKGSAHAFDVVLFFPDDFEIRRIKPVSVSANDKKYLEIALKPVVKGTVPLEITTKCRDGRGENYESRNAFWINVEEFQEPEKARELNHSLTPGAPRAVPSPFPEELAAFYKDIEYIGGGGFARVFKAKRQDERQVAIKLPRSSDTVTGKSFMSELMNWTGLEHENIVKVYDFNILPIPYFEIELCDCSLSEKQLPIDDNSSAWILFNICEGLKYAHSKSIIHQDLKPQNILLKEGILKISDWGLSKVSTISGTSLLGGYTPLYAAPEQISKKFGKKDARTDIWQLGVIFYEIVTGKTPFEGDDPVMVMSSIMMEDPEPPSSINPEAEKLDPIIMKCLEKKQEKRYQSVSELQKDIAGFLRIDYTESLRISISRNDVRRSAFYCGELFIVHLKLGEMETAYKYASDLLYYAQGEVRDITNELCTQLEVRIDNGICDMPDELMKKAENIVHKVGLGFRE